MIGYGGESGCRWTCGRDSCIVFRLQKWGGVWTSRRGWGKIMGMSQLHDVSNLAQFVCMSLGMSVVPERGWGA